jgi:hypothetical protein
MRSRERFLESLETVYRRAFEEAGDRDDQAAMERLDLDYQRDQLYLEVLLDLRELLTVDDDEESGGLGSILEQARALRGLTRLP